MTLPSPGSFGHGGWMVVGWYDFDWWWKQAFVKEGSLECAKVRYSGMVRSLTIVYRRMGERSPALSKSSESSYSGSVILEG